MAEIKDGLFYNKSHEWAAVDGETVTVGITDYAQEQLTDIVYVELPPVGQEVKQNEACAVVESCKVAADVYAPFSGKVVAVNEKLEDSPETVNVDPFGDGWFFQIERSDKTEDINLLSPEQYKEICEQ